MLRQAFVTGSIAEAGRRLGEVQLFSPGLPGLADPARYGGPVLALLTAVGLGARGRSGDGTLRVLYGVVLGLGILLSLGPAIPGLPLYEALHRWLPFFAMIRNPDKFRVLVSAAGVVLVALGARALLARVAPTPGPRRALAVGGLVTLVLAGTAPWHGIAVARFGDSPVFETLRRGAATRVLYLPVWPGDSAHSSLYLYAITRTRVPALNGYSPLVPRDYVRRVFEPLEPLNVGDLGPAEAAALRGLGVSHVVVDRAVFPPQVSAYPSAFTLERLRTSTALALELAADPLWLFRVTGAAASGPGGPTSPVGLFHEAEGRGRLTGVVLDIPGASGGRVVAARPGVDPPGFLTFGPSPALPAGGYVARFRARGGGLRLDVAADRGRRIVADRAADPGPEWTDVTLPFAIDRGTHYEFRVAWDGRTAAAVDWVLVVAADRPDPEWTYEVEALPHRLGEVADPQASGGWAGYADPGESLRGGLVGGPTRLFPAGRYRLSVRLRAAATGQGPLVALAATEPAGTALATRTVAAADVPPGAYHEATLDFELRRPTVLEFPVAYLGDVGVFFDRVTVAPR
jgi:hypothetical protein